MRVQAVLLIALICCQSATSLRILGLFPHNIISHWIMAEKLLTSLTKRGHHVDVATHFSEKNPMANYTMISLEGTIEQVMNNVTAADLSLRTTRIGQMKDVIEIVGTSACKLFALPQMQQLIKNPPKDPPYDLVIVEVFLAPCYLTFSRHLNVPMIGMVTSDLYDWLREPMGSTNNPSYMPSIFSNFDQRMTFSERLKNTMQMVFINMEVNYFSEKQSKFVEEYFGIKESTNELHKDLSVILVNSHHSLNGIKPMTQNIIEVGGLHISENVEPMSPKLQKWLDESTSGCILFTFGSMMRIETFHKPLLEALYKVFEKIAPVRVMLKIVKKEDLLPGLPKNVMTQPWFPQASVLKHKNMKAFITHGGMLSIMEAIYYSVPIIGVPLFGDQYKTIKSVANKNIGVSLGSLSNLTEETLTDAINAILYDNTYRTNMKKASECFRDRPMSALDMAIYWVEYVAKYGNVLQSPAVQLNWWQRNLFDVYGFIVASAAIVLYTVIFILRRLMNRLFSCKSCLKKNGRVSNAKKTE